jgi:hypothetical protein
MAWTPKAYWGSSESDKQMEFGAVEKSDPRFVVGVVGLQKLQVGRLSLRSYVVLRVNLVFGEPNSKYYFRMITGYRD